jgi:excisionase family DNA binding protein
MNSHHPDPRSPVQLTLSDAPLPSASAESGRPPTTRQRTCTVEKAAEILGISRSHAYKCVRSGDIPSVRLRGRIVVPVRALDVLLGEQYR